MQNNAYQQLAKDFMDLWQKQVSAVVSDKQFIQAMLEMFQTVQNQSPNDRTNQPADASAAAHADHGMLAELAFRLAMCERRIAALEEQKKPAKRNAGGRSARGKKPRQ